MTPQQFSEMLADAGFNQMAFARFLSDYGDRAVDARTVRRWAAGDRPVPAAVATLLRVMRLLPRETQYTLAHKYVRLEQTLVRSDQDQQGGDGSKRP